MLQCEHLRQVESVWVPIVTLVADCIVLLLNIWSTENILRTEVLFEDFIVDFIKKSSEVDVEQLACDEINLFLFAAGDKLELRLLLL